MIGNIRAFNDEILRERRRELGHLPVPESISLTALLARVRTGEDTFSIPYVGREKVKGFKPALEEALFVDTSGFGAPGEPALTIGEMLAEMVRLTEEKGTLCWGLIEVGQFQGYLMAWKAKGA